MKRLFSQSGNGKWRAMRRASVLSSLVVVLLAVYAVLGDRSPKTGIFAGTVVICHRFAALC